MVAGTLEPTGLKGTFHYPDSVVFLAIGEVWMTWLPTKGGVH
jgi:hypothetical protein